MRIAFQGATREVTGSCYLIESTDARILVDCGMFQGSYLCESKNFSAFSFDPSTIDAVIISHAHLDHTGRLPKLVKDGFRGKIYCTPPTVQLAQLVIQDAYHIMHEDFKREYRPPLYDEGDMQSAFDQMVPVDYSRHVSIGNLSFRFREAGHIFGSAFIEVEERGGARASFSGDLGNDHVPILRPKAQLAETDVLVVESTYGNRVHEDESTREEKLKAALLEVHAQHGTLIIPAFAIERTQQLLYEMNHLVEHHLIPPITTYLDSPMAIGATEIIKQYPQYYAKEALTLVSTGDDLFDFPGLHITRSREESKTINSAPSPKVIIAGSGMMNGGRILHHLVRYLGDRRSMVLIIGYQAEGTLGRHLYHGEKHVQVLGEKIEVRAHVVSIGAYSAHADQHMILRWIKQAEHPPTHVYCTHGDESASAALATQIRETLHIPADVPRLLDVITV